MQMEKIIRRIKRLFLITKNTLIVYKNPGVRYYNQYSFKYFFKPYGQERMGPTACGPFVCAIVASTLLKQKIDPQTVAKWSYDNGYYERGHGSLHSLIPNYCEKMGLKCVDLGYRVDEMEEMLKNKQAMAILLCKQNTFSAGRHFITVGVQGNKLKVYNSGNVLDCYRTFDKKQLRDALVTENVYIGPIWCIVKE